MNLIISTSGTGRKTWYEAPRLRATPRHGGQITGFLRKLRTIIKHGSFIGVIRILMKNS
jgi:hypothetical protein